jgi:hypothetical protein
VRAYCRSRFLRMEDNLGIPNIAAQTPRDAAAHCPETL